MGLWEIPFMGMKCWVSSYKLVQFLHESSPPKRVTHETCLQSYMYFTHVTPASKYMSYTVTPKTKLCVHTLLKHLKRGSQTLSTFTLVLRNPFLKSTRSNNPAASSPHDLPCWVFVAGWASPDLSRWFHMGWVLIKWNNWINHHGMNASPKCIW